MTDTLITERFLLIQGTYARYTFALIRTYTYNSKIALFTATNLSTASMIALILLIVDGNSVIADDSPCVNALQESEK